MGGLLAPELTSGTKLTPKVVSQANEVYLQAISAWNKSLSSQGLEPVQPIKAVGSTSHFEQDATATPDELEQAYGTSDVHYGDIDYLVQYPFPESFDGDDTERRKEENRVKREYGQLMQDFFDSPESPKEVKAVSQPMIVVELPSGEHVQVDAIVTYPKYSNWMTSRYGSERGLKGYITGNLYAALGEALVLTIGTEGVLSRTRGGERVSSRVRKDVVINSVSTDPQNFLLDIAGYIIGSDDFEVSPTLQRHSGWDEDAVRLSDIGKGIVGLAETLESNVDGFSKRELLSNVLSVFEAKLNGTIDKKRKMMAKKGVDGEGKLSKLEKQNQKSLNLMSSIFNTELSLNEQSLRNIIREVRSSLNEMIVRGDKDGNYIVAFRKYIWRFDDSPSEEVHSEMNRVLKIDSDWDDFYDLTDDLDSRSDVLLGTIDDNDSLFLHSLGSFKFDPQSSILVKKVVKELGLSSVSYGTHDEDEEHVSKWAIKGEIPKRVYHGTSTNYIQSLMRFGLVPDKEETNYEGISHPEAVFFSSRKDEALMHAKHTARKVGGLPVVIELTVPDKNLIIPDYDIDIGAGDTGCYDYICSKLRDNQSKYSEMEGDSLSLSREFGIYGYKGRIPASHFLAYYLPRNQEEWEYDGFSDFFEVDDDEMEIFSQTLEELGYGMTELPEDEEEDDEWMNETLNISYLRKLIREVKTL